jgi:hypothetical protein
MPQGHVKRERVVVLEIAVHHLSAGATHAGRSDTDQDFCLASHQKAFRCLSDTPGSDDS